MNFPKIWRMIARFCRKYKRPLLAALVLLGLLFAVLYLCAFFSRGMDWNDAFLRRTNQKGVVTYHGRDHYGEITVAVKPLEKSSVYDVTYTMPDGKNKIYRLQFGAEKDFWRELQITYRGETVFSGKYQRGNHFLYSKADRPTVDDNELFVGKNPYLNFSPNLRRMAGIAMGEYDHLRGRFGRLLLGLCLAALVLIDIKVPRITMRIREFFAGDEAHPTDLFELIQRAARGGLLIAAMWLLLAAI